MSIGSNVSRRDFLVGTGLMATAAIAASAEQALAIEKSATLISDKQSFGDKLSFTAGLPNLQAPGETSIGIVWKVPTLSKGAVEYADNPELHNSKIALPGSLGLVPIDSDVLSVRIKGLKSATKYYYRTITEPFVEYQNIYKAKLGAPVFSPIYSFTTLGKELSGHFCVMNDTHAHWKSFRKIVGKMKELHPEVVVWNGDATNSTQEKRVAVEIFLDPPIAERDYSATLPVLFVPGNHDFRGSWACKLDEVVLPRHPDERSGDEWDLKWNFAVRCGDAALIGMDTGEDKPDEHPKWFGLANFSAYRRAQAAWLEKALSRPEIADAKFKVLFCHIPLLPNNEAASLPPWDGTTVDPVGFAYWSRECRDLWAPLIEKAGIQLVVTAHMHEFGFFPATPKRPWAMVTGGGPEIDCKKEHMVPTVIEGQMEKDGLRLKVHDVENNRIIFDSIIKSC